MASEITSTTSTETISESGSTQPTLEKDHPSENSEEDDENFLEGVIYCTHLT